MSDIQTANNEQRHIWAEIPAEQKRIITWGLNSAREIQGIVDDPACSLAYEHFCDIEDRWRHIRDGATAIRTLNGLFNISDEVKGYYIEMHLAKEHIRKIVMPLVHELGITL